MKDQIINNSLNTISLTLNPILICLAENGKSLNKMQRQSLISFCALSNLEVEGFDRCEDAELLEMVEDSIEEFQGPFQPKACAALALIASHLTSIAYDLGLI